MADGNPYVVGPFKTTIDDVRDSLFAGLSLTSQFKVSLLLSSGSNSSDISPLIQHFVNCGLLNNNTDLDKCDFLCSEAVLPGSTYDMAEEYGSRQGIIERFPTRRVYSDFNLTFYVDADYRLIRLFEEWMNYIDPLHSSNNLVYDGDPAGQANNGYFDRTCFYRFKYPNTYRKLIAITKFERNYAYPKDGTSQDPTSLTYYFVDAFPTNITALPLSYEGSTITKTTVNFSYSRYIVTKHDGVALNNEAAYLSGSTSQ